MGPVDDIVVELYRIGAIVFGSFRLSSGRTSPYYVDLRILPSYPSVYRRVMESLARLLEGIEYDVLAGVATAGIIHAAYLGCLAGAPIAYVRKEPKGHGMGRLVEGVVSGRRALVVDDVATTGSSIARAVRALRREGALVSDALVILDRLEGAREALGSIGVRLHSLLTAEDILRVLEERHLASRCRLEELRRYLGLG